MYVCLFVLKEIENRWEDQQESFLNLQKIDRLICRKALPVWLRNRLIFAVLEQLLSHTENSRIASYYR